MCCCNRDDDEWQSFLVDGDDALSSTLEFKAMGQNLEFIFDMFVFVFFFYYRLVRRTAVYGVLQSFTVNCNYSMASMITRAKQAYNGCPIAASNGVLSLCDAPGKSPPLK